MIFLNKFFFCMYNGNYWYFVIEDLDIFYWIIFNIFIGENVLKKSVNM